MYRNAIKYKDLWLAPGSEAFRLHQEKKLKQLDEHLKDVNKRHNKLLGIKE